MEYREPQKELNPAYRVILYYKYVRIDDPERLVFWHKEYCKELGLTGRIIIAEEGINGTLEGEVEKIEEYCAALKADPRFSDIHFKESHGTGSAFPRLSVKHRPEIVSSHLPKREQDINPNRTTGKRLSPDELREWYKNKKDFQIIDMRNDYEFKVGRFKGSTFPGIKNFYELPEKLDEISHLKDKTVVTVCTGGVRCEKASGLLREKGFKDVYQLDGGIVSYMEKYPGEDFEGTLYVFDGRLTMDFDPPEKHSVIGSCDLCGGRSENYADCAVPECPRHFICCPDCYSANGKAYCSKECEEQELSTEKSR